MRKRSCWGFYPLFILGVGAILLVVMLVASLLLFALVSLGILDFPEVVSGPDETSVSPLHIFLLIVIASIIIGVLLAVVFGRKTAKPVDKLSDGMRSVASGDFSVRLDEQRAPFDEIHHNFNMMVEDLSSIEMLRNDFIANVSHEFKSPLSSIQGYATLLQDPSLSEEDRQEYLQAIIAATRSLSNMSSNILELSSLETQGEALTKGQFSLDEQLRQVIVMLEPLWAEKGLRLKVDLDKLNVIGNEEMLATVWTNLIVNAIKFTQPNGSIRIRLTKAGSFAKVSVADTGCGISNADQRRIFDKFYQSDASRETEGNGLGLALAFKILEKHEGTIQVKSERGKGSEFTVLLPL